MSVERGNRVNYQFTNANHLYTAMEIPLGNQHVPASREEVTVYYDPMDPTVSSINDLHEKSTGVFGHVPFLVVASSAVIFFILHRIRVTRRL